MNKLHKLGIMKQYLKLIVHKPVSFTASMLIILGMCRFVRTLDVPHSTYKYWKTTILDSLTKACFIF